MNIAPTTFKTIPFVFLLATAMPIGVGLAAENRATTPAAARSVTYSPHAAEFSCHMNLGPTGAAAWMRGYHFVVMSIQQESPGYERLRLGDVVIGVAGQEFGPDTDPRMTLGDAIGEAQATGEPLNLIVLRDRSRQEVAIDLPRLGRDAVTWPWDCEKSRRLLDEACQSLLDAQMPNGQVPTDGSFGMFTAGLLFLASGESEYLDAARRAAYQAAQLDYSKISYNNWAMGYGGLLMAEYFLATGDDTVLPKLEEVAGMIAAGQMLSGTWGHKSPAEGYGALNQTGLVAAMTLVLARECGVKVDERALEQTLTFFARYAGTGSVPYGDHRPGGSLDDNGKNAMAAVLFQLAGREDVARVFAASVAESYWLREEGHTGGLFSIMWGPLGAALADDDKRQAFLDYQRWYYNLARRWDGALVLLPYREALTRFDNSSYIYSGGPFTTGGMAWVYALPAQRLRILGAPPSVFGATLGDGPLDTARAQYLARDWSACDATLSEINPAELTSDQQRHWLEQLRAARALTRQSTDRILLEIDSNLEDGAAYRASEQFNAMRQALGDEADSRFADLAERFAEGTTAWHVREGKEFYERWEAMVGFTVRSWVPQGNLAQRMLEGVPSPRLPYWAPLAPTSQLTPQPWRTLLLAPDQALPEGWEQPDFDDRAWHDGQGILTSFVAEADELRKLNGPIAARQRFTLASARGDTLRVRLRTVRNAQTRVYLNGTLIAHIERGKRGGYATIPLHDRAHELLREGENVLAVTATEQGRANNHLDVGLEINRRGTDPRHLPIHRATVIDTTTLPETDTTLRVADTTTRYRDNLRQSFLDQSVAELLPQLHSPIAYYRALAEDALVAHGLEGIEPAVARLTDDDWKARHAALSVIRKAHQRFTSEDHEAGLAYLAAQLPAITKAVDDPHFWVRTQACHALGDFKAGAKDAAPALRRATGDTEEWVRQAALAALRELGADPADLLTATQQAVALPNSSFGIPRQAVDVVKQPAGEDSAKLAILADILRQPPEGGGGALLVEVIDLACALDPEGTVMIPLLIDAAADKTHLSRQRGNPRGKAIAALGSYGPKASAAVPTLQAILDDTTDKAQSQHDAARLALQTITGSEPTP